MRLDCDEARVLCGERMSILEIAHRSAANFVFYLLFQPQSFVFAFMFEMGLALSRHPQRSRLVMVSKIRLTVPKS